MKAPCCVAVWPGQKRPLAFERVEVPVVSGFRSIAMSPTNWAQRPPGQSAPVEQALPLLEPRKHFCAPLDAAGAGQSLVKPTEFFE